MGRLWKIGDRVELSVPVRGMVVDVLGGGMTVVEIDDTADYITVDEEYWSVAE
jgi:hypothetical protein